MLTQNIVPVYTFTHTETRDLPGGVPVSVGQSATITQQSDLTTIGHYYIFTEMNQGDISSVELVLASKSDLETVDAAIDVKVVDASNWNVSNFPAAF
jgi:hypothetical protein